MTERVKADVFKRKSIELRVCVWVKTCKKKRKRYVKLCMYMDVCKLCEKKGGGRKLVADFFFCLALNYKAGSAVRKKKLIFSKRRMLQRTRR